AIATLLVEVRTANEQRSDTLRLAAWFTENTPPVDADSIFSELAVTGSLNDLTVSYWQDPDEIPGKIFEVFRSYLDFQQDVDIDAFNRAVGLGSGPDVLIKDAADIERFQILSPVRGRSYGTNETNRWIQSAFRRTELRNGRAPYGVALGEQEIVL